MLFKYKNYTAPAIKSLILHVFNDSGEILDLELVECDGIKWNSGDSKFIKELDTSIDKYKLQLDLLIHELQMRLKSEEVYALSLMKNKKSKNWINKILEKAINEPEPKDLKESKLEQKKLANKIQEIKKKLH